MLEFSNRKMMIRSLCNLHRMIEHHHGASFKLNDFIIIHQSSCKCFVSIQMEQGSSLELKLLNSRWGSVVFLRSDSFISKYWTYLSVYSYLRSRSHVYRLCYPWTTSVNMFIFSAKLLITNCLFLCT